VNNAILRSLFVSSVFFLLTPNIQIHTKA
jgi:hypothetical protein